jgi:hypothetical protein
MTAGSHFVNEMKAYTVHFRTEMPEGVEEPFFFSPVETPTPVVAKTFEVRGVHAVVPSNSLHSLRETRPGETALQVVKDRRWDVNSKRLDGHEFLTSSPPVPRKGVD